MSWFARLVNRSTCMSEKRKRKAPLCGNNVASRHERNEVSFVINVMRIFQDDTMLRQITESVLINMVEVGKLINSKSEWNYASIPRAVVIL